MVNQNQRQNSKPVPFSKEATAMCTPEYVEKLKSIKIENNKQKSVRLDPVQALLTASIFVFLAGAIYYVMGPISMLAMSIGGILSVYHMISSKSKMFSKNKSSNVLIILTS